MKKDGYDCDRETRWCLRQVRRGYETYESMVHLITLTPCQEHYLQQVIGPVTATLAVKQRQEVLQRFEFGIKHATALSE